MADSEKTASESPATTQPDAQQPELSSEPVAEVSAQEEAHVPGTAPEASTTDASLTAATQRSPVTTAPTLTESTPPPTAPFIEDVPSQSITTAPAHPMTADPPTPANPPAPYATVSTPAASQALQLAPDTITPLFLTTQTLELFKLRAGEDVTAVKPFRMIPKSDLLADIQARAAISDFHPAKQLIIEYPGEELLAHWDPDFKYGQNFFLCIKPEAVDAILKPLVEEVTSSEQPSKPQQRQWQCLGSDKEIESEMVTYNRELIHVKLSRKRKDFGTPFKLGDRDAHDAYIEFKPVRDLNYEVMRMELPVAVQAVPQLTDAGAQTSWYRPLNMAVQYEPILLSAEDREVICQLDEMEDFLRTVTLRFEKVLQQNSLVDIFSDDYKALGEDDVTLEQGAHTYLQEYQSFTDLKHSKDRSISDVEWHPVQKGVVAISCVQPVTFDERVEKGFNVQSKHNLIIIWSFHDPIHPQLMLEAPDNVTCFQFNPHDPNIIVGGCLNGQIVIWDISEHSDKLKSNRKSRSSGDESSRGSGGSAAGDVGGSGGGGNEKEQQRQVDASVMKQVAVSSIEFGHRGPVQDIHWLPKTTELLSSGEAIEHAENGHRQIVSCSLDGQVLFWDTRYKKELRALDLIWKPFLRVPLSSLDNTFDYGLTKICIKPVLPSERSASELNLAASEKQDKDKGGEKHFSSKFYCATEEGDLIYSDWVAEKSGEDKASRVEQAYSCHFGPMSDLQRSPFFPDILLSVGGWSFHVWKEKVTMGPLLSSAQSSAYLICGRWSPTRPGVFYISKSDGTIEIWDLLDRSHSPSATQNISSTAISAMSIHHYHGKGQSYHQFIAAGDDEGTLHILEVPTNLTKPSKNEKSVIRVFFEREVRRLNYVTQRKQLRIKERAQFEAAQLEAIAAASRANNPSGADGGKAAGAPEGGAPNTAGGEAGVGAPQQNALNADDEDERAEKEYLAMEQHLLQLTGVLQEEIPA